MPIARSVDSKSLCSIGASFKLERPRGRGEAFLPRWRTSGLGSIFRSFAIPTWTCVHLEQGLSTPGRAVVLDEVIRDGLGVLVGDLGAERPNHLRHLALPDLR